MNQPADPDALAVRLHQQSLLAELGRQALEETDFRQLIDRATHLTAIGMDVKYCKILEFLPDQNCFLVVAGVGWHEGVVGHATIAADSRSPAGYALRTGRPVISNHLEVENRFSIPELLLEHGVRRAINVIMVGENQPYGVLEVDSERPGVFTDHDIDFLQSVAHMLGLALKRRQAEDALRQMNETLEQRVEDEVGERRLAEDALRQAQKMEAVGQLTGGVAHDFNNLLLVIMGNLELIGRAVTGNERLTHFVEVAHKGALRGARLTSQLLAFARRQTLRPERRPINDLIREFDALAAKMLGGAIEVTFKLDPNLGACEIDPAQFGSALLNLAVNARDAMPQGGKLTVRSVRLTLSPRTAARHADARPGAYAVVEVTDTGMGMPADIVERATEPFFSTKDPGRGTGLGLSQVYGFVRQSGGFLTIESQVGLGTTVCIHLPEVTADPVAQPNAVAAIAGHGTILVVEDDVDVQALVVLQLKDLGYEVLTAGSGQEALDLLAAPATPAIDLILTDVIMPGGMNGTVLAAEVRRLRPEIKLLLTSGYTAGNGLRPSDGHGTELPLLAKPYEQADLARAIQVTLGRRR